MARAAAQKRKFQNELEAKLNHVQHDHTYSLSSVISHHYQLLANHLCIYLLSKSKPIPLMASGRLKRWGLTLEAYEYTIKHKPGKELANADSLSQLPLPHYPETVPVPRDIHLVMQHLNSTSVTEADIKRWTDKDPFLARVRQFIMTGWPHDSTPEEALHPYTIRKDELSMRNGYLLWGSHVVVPPQGRNLILRELHEAHPGISCMKSEMDLALRTTTM